MPLSSARFRLTFVYSLALFSITAAFAVFMHYRLARNLDKQMDGFLKLESARVLRSQPGEDPTLQELTERLLEFDTPEMRDQMLFGIRDVEGKIVLSSGDFDSSVLPINNRLLGLARTGDYIIETVLLPAYDIPVRSLTVPVQLADGTIVLLQLGLPIEGKGNILGNFVKNMFYFIPAAVCLTVLLGAFLVSRSFVPMKRIVDVASRISQGNLRERIPEPRTKNEFATLIAQLNGMLDRLEESFERVTRFTQDASHELKTPLSRMRAEIEMALKTGENVEQYRNAMIDLLGEIDPLNSLLNDLSMLASGDRDQMVTGRDLVSMPDLLADVMDDVGITAEENGIHLDVGPIPEIEVPGNPQLLARMFANIFDNALTHTPVDGTVALSATLQGDTATFEVSDTGSGVSEEHLARIFDRFYRVDPSRSTDTGGRGLGLDIARMIARAHGGSIRAANRPPHGAVFTIVLPIYPRSINKP